MKLETERLILRKPRMSDLNDLVEGLNNLKVTKNLMVVKFPYTKEEGKKWLEKNTKIRKNKHRFLIELKKEKKVIGSISLDVDNHNKKGTTGSWLNEKYWKKGFMTEAKIAVNDYAFNKLNLNKLETESYTFNKASNATQKRMGYELEGTRKKSFFCLATGKIHDANLYGLLNSDWKKQLPKLKKHLKEKIKRLEK
jgi:[ribosomal protein S5]-alanine N-acetyltransferase